MCSVRHAWDANLEGTSATLLPSSKAQGARHHSVSHAGLAVPDSDARITPFLTATTAPWAALIGLLTALPSGDCGSASALPPDIATVH